MGRYLSLPILILAAIVQSTIVPEIRIGEGGPDLVLLFVLSWTLLAGLGQGFAWAMLGGILEDLLSGLPLGTTALALIIAVFLINTVFGVIRRRNLPFALLALAAGTGIYHLALLVILAIIGKPVQIGYALVHVTLPTLIFNVILILPVFPVIGLLFALSQSRRAAA